MPLPSSLTLLTTDFRPETGGVADHLHRLMDALARRTRVSVLTTVCGDGAWPHAYDLAVLPAPPERQLDRRPGDGVAPIRKLHTAAYFLGLRRYAARTLSRRAGDGPVLVGIWDTASHFWCEACRRHRVPYYLLVHGVELQVPLYGRLPMWRARDLTSAARVVANSAATAALASERFDLPRPAAVVHPAVGAPPPADAIARRASELRRELALGDGPTVLSVGRLVARKGFDLVLAAVAARRAAWPSLTCIVAGDGPERVRLEQQIRDADLTARVRLIGAVDELTKWAAYRLCDLFVMPNRLLGGSDWEGFGIVFLEAALSGRAAIGGRNGGVPDAIVDGETGLLIDPERPGELADALDLLLRDADRRARMGAAAAARAARDFTPDAGADALCRALGWTAEAREP